MKKNIFKLMALLFVCLCCGGFLASCGDDDDEPENNLTGDALVEELQGTWTFERMKIQVMGQTVEYTADELRNETDFYGDFYDDVLTFSGNKVNGYSYSVSGNMVLLPWYEEQDWWASVSFSGSRMTLSYDITEQGVNMQLHTTYVRTGSRSQAVVSTPENAQKLLPQLVKLGK